MEIVSESSAPAAIFLTGSVKFIRQKGYASSSLREMVRIANADNIKITVAAETNNIGMRKTANGYSTRYQISFFLINPNLTATMS